MIRPEPPVPELLFGIDLGSAEVKAALCDIETFVHQVHQRWRRRPAA